MAYILDAIALEMFASIDFPDYYNHSGIFLNRLYGCGGVKILSNQGLVIIVLI